MRQANESSKVYNALIDTMALNEYGDESVTPTSRFGVDVSSQRLDELDMRALEFVIGLHPGIATGIDLGCGLGTPSLAFALAGAHMMLVDVHDFSARFEHLAEIIPLPRIQFIQRDLTELQSHEVPEQLAFAYSQRTLHYLRCGEALRLLRVVALRLASGAPMFLSFSGLDSELGEGYAAVGAPIEERFARLAPAVARKHHIEPPVCLYTESDVRNLAAATGLRTDRVWTSNFGNIKAELSKPQ